MHSPYDDTSDDELLGQALAGNRDAWPKLIARLGPPLLKVAAKWGRGLPRDLHGEIVQEVWTALCALPGDVQTRSYDPRTRTAFSYIVSFVPNAAQRVRSAYRAPAEPSRRRRPPELTIVPRHKWEPKTSSALEDLEELTAEPGFERWIAARDARLDIERAARLASPELAIAIAAVVDRGSAIADAAASTGLTETTLRRRLASLRNELLAA